MLLGATQYHVGLRIDTVGVWGSNPHAPTNTFNNLALTTTFSVAPKRSIQSKNRCHHSC